MADGRGRRGLGGLPRSVIVGVGLVAMVVVVGALATVVVRSRRPSHPRRTSVPGFGEVRYEFRPGGGVRCGLFARTEAQRERGLMARRDRSLGGHDGMLFRFDADTTVPFWMRNTPMPLSIAWFRADGSPVSATDMTPCADRPDCPVYPAAGSYRYALEVPRGVLSRVGFASDRRLVVLPGAC